MTSNVIFASLKTFRNFSSSRRSFTVGKIVYNKPTSSHAIPEVSGLSEACVKIPSQPVGPGAAKNTGYKNPEYFCYNQMSYYEAEVEMLKYRLPQPSTDKPYYQETK